MEVHLAVEVGGTNLSIKPFRLKAGKAPLPKPFTSPVKGFSDLLAVVEHCSELLQNTREKLKAVWVGAPSPGPNGIIPNSASDDDYAGFYLGVSTTGVLQTSRGPVPYDVCNDAVASGLGAADFQQATPKWLVGGPVDQSEARACYITGPGTGLQSSMVEFNPGTGQIVSHASELQHILLPSTNRISPSLRLAIYQQMLEGTGTNLVSSSDEVTFSSEDLVSGGALLRVYNAMVIDQQSEKLLSHPDEVSSAALHGNPLAQETIKLMFYNLGRHAANLMKSHYLNDPEVAPVLLLAGGVVPKLMGTWTKGQDFMIQNLKDGIADAIRANNPKITETFVAFYERFSIGYYPQSPAVVGLEIRARLNRGVIIPAP